MLLSNLNLLATAPGGVARLRELILTLAVQGKLVPQDPADEPASVLLQKIRAEKDRLIAEGKIKKGKPLVAIADEEKPFELPVGWEWVQLAVLAEQITKGTTPTTFGHGYTQEGVNFVKIENLDRGRLNLAQMTDFISPETHEIMSRSQLSAGDVLFSIAGTIGKTAVVLDADLPANTNQALAIIKGAAKHVNQRFLLLALDSFVSNKVKEKARGGAMNNISLGDLSELLMTIPPLAEQSRIVARVEELMRLCDALQAKGQLEATQHAQLLSTLLGTLTASATPEELADNWQRVAQHFDLLLDRPQAIDALEQTVLQLAVRGLLVPQDPTDEPASVLLQKIRAEKDRLITEGKIKKDKPLPPVTDEEKPFELPVGWEWVRMGAVVNASEAGWSPACIGSPRRTGLWGVLKVSAVSWGEFDANANKELPSDLVPRPEYEVRDGDFLLSRANTAELVARSVVVEQAEPKLMLSDKIIRLAVSSQMNRSFLNMANNASYAREHYAVNVSGTSSSMKNVSREVVLALPVPVPPLAEQSRIVTRVTQLRRLCFELRQRLAEREAVQARLAEALVQQVA